MKRDPQFKPGNHWLALTLNPGALAASIGAEAQSSWIADGPYTIVALNCSELGTGNTDGFHEFEMSIKAAGYDWSNLPVSARALSGNGKGRPMGDLLEGRVLLLDKGDTIDVVFRNVAATAITPRLHLFGHRGWPVDYARRGIRAGGDGRPYMLVIRDGADAALATANNNSVRQRINLCMSMSRLTWGDGVTSTGHRLDIDAVIELSQGAVQTLHASSAAAADRRCSLRSLAGEDEGLDLRRLLGGWPQLMQNAEVQEVQFFNDSGSNVQPRLIYLGHEGMPFGTPDDFGDKYVPVSARPESDMVPDEAGARP
ncbi:MAG: hypothetical protein AB7K09_15670 [Planctomycetota bacterium]